MSVGYWLRERAMRHIVPGGQEWPEGVAFPQWLSEFIGPGAVLEYGCGRGRLAGGFDPATYLGVDISPYAIKRARELRPGYEFSVIEPEAELPVADHVFAHTVLLHVSDEDLPGVAKRMATAASLTICVSEIMGRRWRRQGGEPPVYNREPEEYATAFAFAGCTLADIERLPYRRYNGAELTIMRFR